MKKIISIIFCALIVLAGIGAYWSASHYLLQTRNGLLVLPKRFITFQDTFLDIRNWQDEDFEENASLRESLQENGYGDLLENRPTEPKEGPETDGNATDEGEETEGTQEEDTPTSPSSSAKDNKDSQDKELNQRIQKIAEDVKQRVTELVRGEQQDEASEQSESKSEPSDEASEK